MAELFLVYNDFHFLIISIAGVLAFFLCHELKKSLADRLAWSFLALFAISHAAFNAFHLINRFITGFPFIEDAIPIFAFISTSFCFGFVINIQNYNGNLPSIRRFWYLFQLLGLSGLAFGLHAFALTQFCFLGVPSILMIARAFYLGEVFKVRNRCLCHKISGLWLILILSVIHSKSAGLVSFDNVFSKILVNFSTVFWMLGLWFCVRRLQMEDAAPSVMRSQNSLMVFLPIALLVTFTFGLLTSSFLTRKAFEYDIHSKANLFTTLIHAVKSQFSLADIQVKQIAETNYLKKILSNPQEKQSDLFNETLDHFNRALPNSVCYLIATNGTTIFSSNRNEPDSFVDRNFSFRSYFQEGMQGKPSQMLSQGSISRVFGYYSSRPILSDNEEVLAVAVVKLNLDNFSSFFPDSIPLCLLDENLEIVSSNRPSTFWSPVLPLEKQPFAFIPPRFRHQLNCDLSYSSPSSRSFQTDTFLWKHSILNTNWKFCAMDSGQSVLWARILAISLTLIGTIVSLGIAHNWAQSLSSSSKIEKGARIYKTLVEGSSNIVVLLDLYGNILAVNQTGIRELGLDAEGNSLKRIPEYWNEKTQPLVRQAIQKALTGNRIVCEAEKPEADGGTTYWELILNPVVEEGAAPTQLIGIFHNFTEHKLASLELRRERDLTTSILNTAQAIILLLDMTGKVLRVNQHYYDLTGFKPEEVIGSNWLEKFIADADIQKVSSYFRQYCNNFGMAPLINKINTKNGKLLEIEWKNRTVKDEGGRAIGVISVGQDITHHSQLENKLRESKSKVSMLNNSFVRFGSSPEENITVLNEVAWLITGADAVFTKECLDETMKTLARASVSDDILDLIPEFCHSINHTVNPSKEPFLISDISSQKRICECLHNFQAAIQCNFFLGNVVSGALFCCYQDRTPDLSEEDLGLISLIAQAMGIEIARLTEKRALQEAIQQLDAKNRRMSLEMDIARTVHRSFLPAAAPLSGKFSFGFKFQPSFSVGGDYFDFIPFPELKKMGVFFADISGHGVAGALLSSMLKMILFSVTRDCPTPQEVLSRMNKEIEENFPSGYFVAAFYALIDEDSQQINFANAAPEPALVVRENGRVEILCHGGQPMGLLPPEFTDAETFAGTSVILEPGEKLVFFTDGLTDIKVGEKERIGLERLSRWFSEAANLDAQIFCDEIYRRAVSSAVEKGIDDDIMLLAVARSKV